MVTSQGQGTSSKGAGSAALPLWEENVLPVGQHHDAGSQQAVEVKGFVYSTDIALLLGQILGSE